MPGGEHGVDEGRVLDEAQGGPVETPGGAIPIARQERLREGGAGGPARRRHIITTNTATAAAITTMATA
ncbi:MAG TPA: hypothetical protein RMH80_33805, partial [Polyangiaceae bacterium LLY-WYZ-15_(1-7)]|nr:hypothetical protein [Polyangiaceae bacterium LLY-WYZ-15_(1-7)]